MNSIWCCAWGKYKDVDGTEDAGSGVSSSSNGSIDFLITGSVDESVKVWMYKDREIILMHKFDHSLGVSSVAINTKGTRCVSSSLDSSLCLWNLQSGKKMYSIDVGPIDICCLDFSPDDNVFACGSNSGKITFHDVESGKLKNSLMNEAIFIMSIAFSPDGNSVASGTMGGIITTFDVATGKMLHAMQSWYSMYQ
ncbi:Protein will die slowly [Gryllus bimaculatus]|nr:Protein will die slowly [Gryllus bimaculatus]